MEIELDLRRDLVVLLGESTARGYFYDPVFTPAKALNNMLSAALGDSRIQVLDLARTNASMEQVLALLQDVSILRPRAIAIWAGNNWFPLEDITAKDAPGVAAVIRKGASAHKLKSYLEALHRQRVQAFIDSAAATMHAMDACGVLVVPAFNLLGWHDSVAEAPPITRDRRTLWAETRRKLLAAQAAGDHDRIESHANKLIRLDGGLGSLGLRAKASLCLREDPLRARALLEEALDAELWPKSPRCHCITAAELRGRGAAQGFEIVDLPQRFATHTGAAIPPQDLFLDYCHHSQDGLRIACAMIAEALLQCAFGIAVSAPELTTRAPEVPKAVEARARFLAAAHNAAHAQPEETLRRHLDTALAADPELEAVSSHYIQHRFGHAPFALAAGHIWETQCERYFGPSELRRGVFDLHFATVIEERLGRLEHTAELIAGHAIGSAPVDLLSPSYGQLITMDERTLESCGFHRSRRSTSSFIIALLEPATVTLDVSYRTRDAHPSAAVEISCGARVVARLPVAASWRRVNVCLPASALAAGMNLVHVAWPASKLEGHEILADFAEALELGEAPVAPYPVLGEIFTLRASL